MTTATIASAPDGPLTLEHHQAIVVAHARAKTIRAAAKVASFNGWSTGVFAAASVLFVFFSLPALLITIGLGIVTYNEFRGRRLLLQFDPSGPTLLGWNQVALFAMVTVYCLWTLSAELLGNGSIGVELAAHPELAMVLGSPQKVEHLHKVLTLTIYGTVIAVSAVFQGWCALYYFRRLKLVENFVRETPEWVLNLQRLTTDE